MWGTASGEWYSMLKWPFAQVTLVCNQLSVNNSIQESLPDKSEGPSNPNCVTSQLDY